VISEAVPLASEETRNAKVSVPRGMIWGIAFILASAFITLMIGVSVNPGEIGVITATAFPMLITFQQVFNTELAAPALALIIIPGLFVSAHTFVFAYSRQMYSMSRSGFLPSVLSVTSSAGTPWVAMCVGSGMGFFIVMIGQLGFPYTTNPAGYILYQSVIYNWMLFFALINYTVQLVSYIIFQLKYSMLSRQYRSPFKIPGAVIGIVLFLLTLIGALGYTEPRAVQVAVVCCVSYLLLGAAYYWFHARFHLRLSPEEQAALFVIYSINFVREKHDRATTKAGKFHIDSAFTDALQKHVDNKVPAASAGSHQSSHPHSGGSVHAKSMHIPSRVGGNGNVQLTAPRRAFADQQLTAAPVGNGEDREIEVLSTVEAVHGHGASRRSNSHLMLPVGSVDRSSATTSIPQLGSTMHPSAVEQEQTTNTHVDAIYEHRIPVPSLPNEMSEEGAGK
jgi:hypothetical protein